MALRKNRDTEFGYEQVLDHIKRSMAHMRNYADWRVGCTGDPEETERELEFPAFFRQWRTDSTETSQKIKDALVQQGMQPATDFNTRQFFVYIF